MVKYIIKDERGYKLLKRRVKKGVKLLKNKWFDPRYKKEAEHCMAMADAMLIWEIENHIFEPKFDEWWKKRARG